MGDITLWGYRLLIAVLSTTDTSTNNTGTSTGADMTNGEHLLHGQRRIRGRWSIVVAAAAKCAGRYDSNRGGRQPKQYVALHHFEIGLARPSPKPPISYMLSAKHRGGDQ